MLSLFSQFLGNALGQNIQEKKKRCKDSKQRQPKLFTPGPLSTTKRVKRAMLFDYGSRDPKFIQIIQSIRKELLEIAEVRKGEYECVLLQGSGTYGVEAVVGCMAPKNSPHKFLVCINGSYGDRMLKIAQVIGVNSIALRYQDNEIVRAEDVQAQLDKDPDITHVGIIHSETTSGIINPIEEIGALIKRHNPKIQYLVDAMSSFGAYQINASLVGIDFLVSSTNKNLQGIPGFTFIIAKKSSLDLMKGNARSLVLDVYAQWEGLELNGQFRFTPPTHVLRATLEAIEEFNEEGGIIGRSQRYAANQKLLSNRMNSLGFRPYIDPKYQGYIITTYLQPNHPKFNFQQFYDYLAQQNLVIYPGKLTVAETFRIGSIGDIYPKDIDQLVTAIQNYLQQYSIPIPVPY